MSVPETRITGGEEHPAVGGSVIPANVPVLPLEGRIPLPLAVESEVTTDPRVRDIALRQAGEGSYVLVAWVDSPGNNGAPPEIPSVSVIARLLAVRELGEGRLRLELEGVCRATVGASDSGEPGLVRISPIERETAEQPIDERKVGQCLSLVTELVEHSGEYPAGLLSAIESARTQPDRLTDLIGSSIHLKLGDLWRLAQTPDPADRLDMLLSILSGEIAEAAGVHDLERRVRDSLNRRQRIDFLRAQLGEVRRELESLEPGSTELDKLAEEIAAAGLPPAIARRARSELERLRMISTASSEYSEIRNYIDWLIHIPWTATAHERTDTPGIRRVLDENFYGQRRAKEKIVEYLTVMHRTGHPVRNVLCVIGPSGIGKTQLGRAISLALRRPMVSMNLGILRSEAALKGNRRTFPGAMPGRLLRQLRAVEVVNPVCVLEEIDRLGGDSDRPDLSAVVLETIDPSLNKDYWDSYLGFPSDLSRILFICTATDPENIPEVLTDRMEFVELPGYLETEKVEVVFKHLWPRQLEAHRLRPEENGMTISAVHKIIREYTMEAGVTNLDKSLEVICRNMAAQRAEGERAYIRVGAQQVEKYLGTPPYIPEKAELKPEIGVAMGVAWTQAGGDIMLIEALKMRGSGNVISTGSLGEVMRESIQAAHSYVRSRADWLGIAHADFGRYDIHVHFPSGAIPKDGPSAGITVSLVIASVMSDRPIRNDIATTGEVSLRGKVLPVGGIKEKVAAAHRVGIHKMIVPRENIKDLKDVPRRVSKEMTYIPVETVDEVFQAALLDFDPTKASLEKLLRLELAKRSTGRRTTKARTGAAAARKRARKRSER